MTKCNSRLNLWDTKFATSDIAVNNSQINKEQSRGCKQYRDLSVWFKRVQFKPITSYLDGMMQNYNPTWNYWIIEESMNW